MSDTQSLRAVFSKYATGVTIITCASDAGPAAIVANSFSSLSLEPPLVGWAVATKSLRASSFLAAEHFAVHILGADQKLVLDRVLEDGFALSKLDTTTGEHGVPVLEGCIARLECRQTAQHAAGDHVLILGEVCKSEMSDGPALAFFSGTFQPVHPNR